ncbi:MAG: hypothetical protein ACI9OJ_002204 [Myxococcota bacterium]|jgi:hypothetical protein
MKCLSLFLSAMALCACSSESESAAAPVPDAASVDTATLDVSVSADTALTPDTNDTAQDVTVVEDIPLVEDVPEGDTPLLDVPDELPINSEISEPDINEPDVVDMPDCDSACDCAQGQACTDGACELGPEPVFCCTTAACPAGAVCLSTSGVAGLCGAALSPVAGALIINEILLDGQVSGDPNGDGDPSESVADEFVEIVNVSDAAVTLDGFSLEEQTFVGLPRHVFTAGTIINPGKAIVIFGGGTAPDDAGGTHFEVANAADIGISFGLSLDDSGDTLVLRDGDGAVVAVFAWGPGAALPALPDRSYTRAPDMTGDFVPHDEAASGVLYSPGTLTDGTSF